MQKLVRKLVLLVTFALATSLVLALTLGRQERLATEEGHAQPSAGIERTVDFHGEE